MALKVAVVGMRGIGDNHASAYSKDPLAKLVAVCDVVKARADEAAKKYGVKAYYSVKDLIAHEDLDAVSVTTGGYENGSWHFEPAMELMEAGKNVLVEKPLSNDVLEARQMVATATAKGVYLGCNLNHYFTPTANKADEYIKAGQVGEMVYCLHKMGFNGGDATYAPAPGNKRWWGFPYAHLKAFLTHPFSVMRHFCGDITHVQAFVDRPGVRKTAGDVMASIASVHVRFVNGCVGYLLSQRGDSTFGLGGWWSLEVSGTRGAFCIENCIEKVTYWPGPKPANAAKPENLAMGAPEGPVETNTGIKDFGQTFPLRIHAYLEDVTNKVHPEKLRANGRDALAALEYTWAVMESYEQGGALVRPYPLPTIHGDPATMG